MKLAFFLRLVAFKVSLFKTGTAGLLGLSANVKGSTFLKHARCIWTKVQFLGGQYVSFYNFLSVVKKHIGSPKKIVPFVPL